MKNPFSWLKTRAEETRPPEAVYYPPDDPGVVVIPPSEVRHGQKALESQLEASLGLGKEFEELIVPVIERLARHVHLLPASQSHHHSGVGGLFRHCLEVAYNTVQASEGVVLVSFFEGTPSSRRARDIRWRVACCLAGMFHDLGKTVTDMRVMAPGGETWSPIMGPLYDWASEGGIDRYYVDFKQGRHGMHVNAGVNVVEHIWYRPLKRWLAEPGQDIISSLNALVAGAQDDSPLRQLVSRADQISVERDLKNKPSAQASPFGVSLARHMIDGMRRLVSQGTWPVNRPGGRVWVTTDGPESFAYVIWKPCSKQLGDLLRRDRIPGVPRDPASMAEVLFDTQMAMPYQNGDLESMYWPIRTRHTSWKVIYALKLPAGVLFPDIVPPTIEVQIGDEETKSRTAISTEDSADIASMNEGPMESLDSASSEGDDVPASTKESPPPNDASSEERGETWTEPPAPGPPTKTTTKRADKKGKDKKDDRQTNFLDDLDPPDISVEPRGGRDRQAKDETDIASEPAVDEANSVSDRPSVESTTESIKPDDSSPTKDRAPASASKTAPVSAEAVAGPSISDNPEQWLRDNGDKSESVSRWLIDLARTHWGVKVIDAGRRAHLVWPDASESFNGSTTDITAALLDAGWLESGFGGGKVQKINGRSVIVIKPRAAKALRDIANADGAPLQPDDSNSKAHIKSDAPLKQPAATPATVRPDEAKESEEKGDENEAIKSDRTKNKKKRAKRSSSEREPNQRNASSGAVDEDTCQGQSHEKPREEQPQSDPKNLATSQAGRVEGAENDRRQEQKPNVPRRADNIDALIDELFPPHKDTERLVSDLRLLLAKRNTGVTLAALRMALTDRHDFQVEAQSVRRKNQIEMDDL